MCLGIAHQVEAILSHYISKLSTMDSTHTLTLQQTNFCYIYTFRYNYLIPLLKGRAVYPYIPKECEVYIFDV